MKVVVEFVGCVRRGTVNSRALVRYLGTCYTWKGTVLEVDRAAGVGTLEVDSGDLEVATNKQIVMGRNSRGRAESSDVEVMVCGVVQRCRLTMRLLVEFPVGSKEMYTISVPVSDGVVAGGIMTADSRRLDRARDDQVDAGLGRGKLRRHRRAGG
jgi:hypothetical protein